MLGFFWFFRNLHYQMSRHSAKCLYPSPLPIQGLWMSTKTAFGPHVSLVLLKLWEPKHSWLCLTRSRGHIHVSWIWTSSFLLIHLPSGLITSSWPRGVMGASVKKDEDQELKVLDLQTLGKRKSRSLCPCKQYWGKTGAVCSPGVEHRCNCLQARGI